MWDLGCVVEAEVDLCLLFCSVAGLDEALEGECGRGWGCEENCG